jgi:ADP-heptose:LPS heptosyltransferase
MPLSATDIPGLLKRALFSLLGLKQRRKFLAKRVRKRTMECGPFAFPIDGETYGRVLLILPPDPLSALFQVENAAAIRGHFQKAQVTVLAEASSASLAAVIGADEVVEYAPEQIRLFSTAFSDLCDRFRDTADCCCLLTRREDLSLLYLAGMTGAQVRVGYGGAAGFPFINLRIDGDPDDRTIPGSSDFMARTLGAPPTAGRIALADDAARVEIDRLLREVRLDGVQRLIGIDVQPLFRLFGAKGAEECISALMTSVEGGLYFFCGSSPTRSMAARLSAMVPPVFSDLTIPQVAALVGRTECVIAGKSLFFGIASCLGTKTVALHSQADRPFPATPAPTVVGVPCSGKRSGGESRTAVISAVQQLLG